MPGKLKVRIVAARDLPVMDRASELTDAFVEVKFGNTIFKTEVFRKSLNPQWNSEWYRFEVDDEDLQDEPLQIRVLDHDTYSAHDAIGKVYIDLNPLLNRKKGSLINGWYPIYDTMHGIRGQLQVIVKVDLFSDLNKFRQSSCGVKFFCTSGIPEGFEIQALHGFVEELVVNDDPEYQWIDKIRSQRASNEARQMQFSKLSGELQRKIGLKVLEMGGNAVIGYRQCFDLEGESGIVVRAIGTSVTLGKQQAQPAYISSPHSSSSPNPDFPASMNDEVPVSASPTNTIAVSAAAVPLATLGVVSPMPKLAPQVRRSSESDVETPQKGGVTAATLGQSAGANIRTPFHRPVLQQESIDMLEYPFFTVKCLPPGFVVHLGGVVSASSVKLLDKIHNPDEPETRDVWWAEIRTEIRSHMKAMGCHAVVGYSEQTSIRDELIILSAIGTAVVVCLNFELQNAVTQHLLMQQGLHAPNERHVSHDRHPSNAGEVIAERETDVRRLMVDVTLANQLGAPGLRRVSDFGSSQDIVRLCSVCHIPYPEGSLPFPVHLSRCAVCSQFKVPDILFATIEPPVELPTVGKGSFLQARICRQKREGRGEANARDISDVLPFMEYELHKQLVNKLKVKGMNSLFGLKIQFTIGEMQIVAIATATGVYSEPLPPPAFPKIFGKADNSSIQDICKKVQESINRNRDIYGLPAYDSLAQENGLLQNSSEEMVEMDATDKKLPSDTFILEIDDVEDARVVCVLLDPPFPDGFEICNTERMPGVPNFVSNLQMFTKVWRGQLNSNTNTEFSNIFDQIMRGLFFKLRTMTPCALCHLDFDIHISDDDEVQVSVTGTCVGIGEPPVLENVLLDSRTNAGIVIRGPGRQIFNDVDRHSESDGQSSQDNSRTSPIQSLSRTLASPPSLGQLSRSETHGCTYNLSPSSKASRQKRMKYHSGGKPRHGIQLTSLSYIPGARIDQYTGHLNFFIIRETTSVREEGGLNGFMHSFLAEVMAICRAHVAALGGNALVAYQVTECILQDNLHKNQSQCLVNVCGDVVLAVYQCDSTASSLVTQMTNNADLIVVTTSKATSIS